MNQTTTDHLVTERTSTITPLETPSIFECAQKTRWASNFADDVFTLHERQQGVIILHILAVLYALIVQKHVTENYLLPATNFLCFRKLKLNTRLAGTTLLAVSYSSPEVFISFMGVFIGNSDISINALLGCSSYNLLVITSSACFCAYKFKISLIRSTLLTDTFFYLFNLLLILFILLRNEFSEFSLHESLVLVSIYLIYVIIANYDFLKNIFRKKNHKNTNELNQIELKNRQQAELEHFNEQPNCISVDNSKENQTISSNLYEEPYDFRKEYKKIALLSVVERTKLIIIFPAILFAYITVIDFRRFEKRRIIYVMFSIFSCLISISISCYMIIWMSGIIAETWQITQLAIGFIFVSIVNRIKETKIIINKCKRDLKQSISSKEDTENLTTSLSNLLASNIFSLSMGLGISYILNALFSPNKHVFTLVKNPNLIFVMIGSIICAILFILFLSAFKWKLKKYLGFCLLFIWSIYNICIILIELKLFKTNVNIFRKCK